MKKFFRLFLLIALFAGTSSIAMAQVTTSSLVGTVKDSKGEPLSGATVKATHVPSGSVYFNYVQNNGRYSIDNMRAGGPYKVEISFVGYQAEAVEGVQLTLGEEYTLDATLKDEATKIGEVVVTAQGGNTMAATQTGVGKSFSSKEITNAPMITRSVTDITRLTPQATVNSNGAISFAGANNRYNSFQIDGAMNNDVFGLTSSGMNGGQASAQPVSVDAIEQIQVSIAPFDVRQSGFSGGAINAITKSGTNEFHGSIYGYGNNQNTIGKTAGRNVTNRTRLTKQHDYQWGVTFGGPIIKNKLFFFVNYERADKSYPTANNLGDGSNITQSEIDQIVAKLSTLSGGTYNPDFGKKDVYTRSDKFGAKLNWNINNNNKLVLRYSYVGAERLNFARSANALRAFDDAYVFNSKTHSFIAELNSKLGSKTSNELRLSYVRVRDSRDPQGAPMPYITISQLGANNGGTLYLGTEYSSCANMLNQDIYSFTDNFTWLLGNHKLTLGTHNELYTFENLFIQNLYGSYAFRGLNNFLNDVIYSYNYGRSKESVTGTDRWAPKFSALQLGFYAQDNWKMNSNFTLTYGLRVDIPTFLDTPTENPTFNTSTIAQKYGVKTDVKPSATPLWSPRVGFRYYVNDDGVDRSLLMRGGVGIFTGRIPFVWLSNSFSNTGVEFEKYYGSASQMNGIQMVLDPNGQQSVVNKLSPTTTTEVDVFSKNFKFTQTARFNLAFEKTFNHGWKFIIEGLFSKTLNDINYKQINLGDINDSYGNKFGYMFDNRPVYSSNRVDGNYTRVVMLSNTHKGYAYNASFSAQKSFKWGLDLSASYTYGVSKSVQSGSSSVAYSNWQYNYTTGYSNDAELGFSAFNIPHRVVASATYSKAYGHKDRFRTTVSVIYTGQSGSPYDVTYYGDINGDGATGNDLIYIPTDHEIDQMQFVATSSMSAAQQRSDMKAWLASDKYLSRHRGCYYQRNADNMKFEHHFDFHFAQDFGFDIANKRYTLQLSADILNVGNMFNKKWGLESYMSNNVYSPITYSGNGRYQYLSGANYDPHNEISDFNSRWRCQFGLKLIF